MCACSPVVCLSVGMTIDDVREYELKMQENTNKLVLDGVGSTSGATP